MLPCDKQEVRLNREQFEAESRSEGYEIRDGEIKPDQHRPAHTHPFDAKLFVLDGSLTLVFGADHVQYQAGDTCSVPAGTMHEEHTEADGVRYVAARRVPVPASAAS